MTKKGVTFISLLLLGGAIIISYLVWYFVNSFIQFHIYWIVLIILGVLFAGAALAEITGYSVRELLRVETPETDRTLNAFVRETSNSNRVLKPKLKGIPSVIPRYETELITEQLSKGQSVLLTGGAGTGKSGIAVALVVEAKKLDICSLLIDARRLSTFSTRSELREYFDVEEPIIDGIERLGLSTGIWLIVDQLDNIAGSRGCTLITDIILECSEKSGVSVVVMSRHKEANERDALRPILEEDFVEIICTPISEEQIREILNQVGIVDPTASVLDLARNLLNLDLICEVVNSAGSTGLENISNNTDLWEYYRTAIRDRENVSGDNRGDAIISEAIRLARAGLHNIDRTFDLEYGMTHEQRRLVSNGIIEPVIEHGLKYQFRHEKLQDYLYAWNACNLHFGRQQVIDEIDRLHLRNIIVWMLDIYQQRAAPEYLQFAAEVLPG
jgi:hypothetical protein